ncbi:unnamed protein product, partial [Laminaria digitata]
MGSAVGIDAAMAWRLFRLSRGVTALLVQRGLSPAPECPVELQAFPALQDLRLDGVPLEYVQGIFALRLQLKSLRFAGAPLASLVALLAPPHAAVGHRRRPASAAGDFNRWRGSPPFPRANNPARTDGKTRASALTDATTGPGPRPGRKEGVSAAAGGAAVAAVSVGYAGSARGGHGLDRRGVGGDGGGGGG